jgi:murein L,D-transpeptidase YafK
MLTAFNLKKAVDSTHIAQALNSLGYMKKVLITNEVTTRFFITPFKSISYTLYALPTTLSRFNHFSVTIFLALLLTCIQPGLSDAATSDTRQIYQLLKNGKSEAVRSLPSGEREILMALLSMKAGRTSEAVVWLKSEKLTNSPLAALIRAEANRQLSVNAANRAGDYARSVKSDIRKLERADLSIDLVEAEKKLQAFVKELDGRIALPFDLLKPGSRIDYIFMVDKSELRMSVYKHDGSGNLEFVTDTAIITDDKTPVGIYRLGNRLTPKAYGNLAFSVDYPNALDQLQGQSNADILMHAGDKAQGGISLTGQSLQDMEQYILPGRSWLVIGESLVFGADTKKTELRHNIFSSLKSWRKDWESRNANAYLSHYHPQFKSDKHDFSSWSEYKRRINRQKSFIQVKLSDFTIIHNPSHSQLGETVLVEFNQRYKSSNYYGSSHKRLYMVRQHAEDSWKIISERETNQ